MKLMLEIKLLQDASPEEQAERVADILARTRRLLIGRAEIEDWFPLLDNKGKKCGAAMLSDSDEIIFYRYPR